MKHIFPPAESGDKTLLSLAPGDMGRVARLRATGSMRRRLYDLGFTEGADVRCIGQSPTGDPRAYRLGGTVVALRRSLAETVLLQSDRKDTP